MKVLIPMRSFFSRLCGFSLLTLVMSLGANAMDQQGQYLKTAISESSEDGGNCQQEMPKQCEGVVDQCEGVVEQCDAVEQCEAIVEQCEAIVDQCEGTVQQEDSSSSHGELILKKGKALIEASSSSSSSEEDVGQYVQDCDNGQYVDEQSSSSSSSSSSEDSGQIDKQFLSMKGDTYSQEVQIKHRKRTKVKNQFKKAGKKIKRSKKTRQN